MIRTPPPLRRLEWSVGQDSNGHYVQAGIEWRGESCDHRMYLGPADQPAHPALIEGAMRKGTFTLAELVANAHPEDMGNWQEAIGWH